MWSTLDATQHPFILCPGSQGVYCPYKLGNSFPRMGTTRWYAPKPTPGEGQALVKIKAFGDEVLGLAYGGAYAEYIAASSKMLIHKPHAVSWEEAAAIPETWITATQSLHKVLEFTSGKSILWHAGASGVSVAGIQLSRLAGASAIYATAGNWVSEIKEATGGKGVDFIIDYVGADYFQKNLDVAAGDCRIVLLWLLSGGKVPDVDISPILFKRIRIEGSTLRSRDEEYQGELRDKLETYMPEFEKGRLKIIVDKILSWEEIVEAHKYMEENKSSGKIVCTIP
ncbi:putative quinone oxidoreductase [Trichoderma compactum]